MRLWLDLLALRAGLPHLLWLHSSHDPDATIRLPGWRFSRMHSRCGSSVAGAADLRLVTLVDGPMMRAAGRHLGKACLDYG